MQNHNNQNRDWRRLSRAERAAQSESGTPENHGPIGTFINLLSSYSNPILIGAVFSTILGIIILLFIIQHMNSPWYYILCTILLVAFYHYLNERK